MSILVFAQGSSSDITTRELSVELFKGIELGGAYEVTLEKGTSCIVKITTQEKIQEKINAKVENGVLKIANNCRSLKRQ